MNEKEIKKKIEEVEGQLKQKITMLNFDYYEGLLDIHNKLWDLLYFKKHQEKTFLKKGKEN